MRPSDGAPEMHDAAEPWPELLPEGAPRGESAPAALPDPRVAEILQQVRSGVRQRAAEAETAGAAGSDAARQGLLALRQREFVAEPVPFSRGGAERLVESLAGELRARGFTVDTVALPFHWPDRVDLMKSALAWRLVDLTAAGGRRIDRVIATRFPSYAVKHPNKVVWLVHQLRQVYDLYGTRYSDFSAERPRDRKAIEMVRAIDRRTLAEARAVYTISGNVADRLRRGNDLAAEVLYPPPPADGAFHPGGFGDYVFSIGRLDRLKRFDLLVRAVAAAEAPVACQL